MKIEIDVKIALRKTKIRCYRREPVFYLRLINDSPKTFANDNRTVFLRLKKLDV